MITPKSLAYNKKESGRKDLAPSLLSGRPPALANLTLSQLCGQVLPSNLSSTSRKLKKPRAKALSFFR